MNSSIFKSYDIRALCPEEFPPEDGERIARAIVSLYGVRRVVIGHDMRGTSASIEAAVLAGFLAAGVQVTKVGLCSTPMFNFAVGEEPGRYDLGLMITASHNPAQYNGIKIVNADRVQLGLGTGLERIRDRAVSDEPFLDAKETGSVTEDPDLCRRYLDRVFSLVSREALEPQVKIVIDAGNGMEGFVASAFAERLPELTVIPLYWELDGRFPNHEANPIKASTLHDLQKKVVTEGALCGFAFDGDADRVGIVDEKGEQIPGDLFMALLAREIGRSKSALEMIYDVRSSRVVSETVEAMEGKAELYRAGTAHIKKRMKETGAQFAGELSMHFYFSDFGNCESGDYVMLLMLQLLAREKKPLSEIWHDLKKYGHSGERNFHAQSPTDLTQRLGEIWSAIPEATLTTIDGIRIDQWNGSNEDWWCSIRASNTEPLLRLNLETRDPSRLEAKVEEVVQLLRTLDSTLAPEHV